MSKSAALIFDLDDTLINTMDLYRQAVDDFVREMIKAGFQELEARRELNRIDVENLKRLGFSRERFPTSMIQTYEFLCERHGMEPIDAVRNQCWTIGNSVFEQTPHLIDGVKVALSALRDRFRLILLTKGDRTIQEARLDQTDLRSFFESTHIVPDKNEEELANLVYHEDLDPIHTWVIGDSPRSDIHPALGVGLRCVWIPKNTWDAEHQDVDTSKVVILDSLYQLAEFFTSLPT